MFAVNVEIRVVKYARISQGHVTNVVIQKFPRPTLSSTVSDLVSAKPFLSVLKWQLPPKVYLLHKWVYVMVLQKRQHACLCLVMEAMASSENHPMDGNVQVDEFVLGGYQQDKIGRSYDAKKKKAITAVEFTDDVKVKHMYALNIKDFSAQSLQYMFVKHIDRKAQVTTDKWKGYRPIAKVYNITQVESNKGLNFKALHTMIHQIKSWLRTTYSWVSEFNLNRYFNEFCFRINHSQNKSTIFNNLVTKMVNNDKIYQSEIICS